MSEAIQFLKLGKSLVVGLVAAGLTATPTVSYAGGAVTGATEMTQLLNNGELISLVGQSSEQITNQITQITQLAEQIQNQLNIYQNMQLYRLIPIVLTLCLVGCQTATDGLSTSAAPADVSGPAASAIAGDMGDSADF